MRDIRSGKYASKLTWPAAVALSVLMGAVTVLSAAAAPAYASSLVPAHSAAFKSLQQPMPGVCGNGGTGYCLNDWNGTIGDVKMYYGGYANDSFAPSYLNMCNGNSQVLGAPYYCPFSDHSLDSQLKGDYIYQILSEVNPGWCIGSAATSSKTIMQPCNTSNGSGGGTGTIFVEKYVGGSCATGDLYVNRYWSDRYNTYEYLESGNALGVQADEDYSGSSPSCWGYT